MDTPHYERIVFRSGAKFTVFRERAEYILENLNLVENINDILEIFNLLKYINDEDTTFEGVISLRPQTLCLNKIVGSFFASITPYNFELYVNGLNYEFAQTFWEIMSSYKKIDGIEKPKFKKYLDENPHHLEGVLMQKKVAIKFNDEIYAHLIDNPYSIRVIISNLLERATRRREPLYIKETISADRLHVLFKVYIECEQANINLVRLINISHNDLAIGLDDETRLCAKRRERALAEDISNSPNAAHYDYSAGVSFRDSDTIMKVITEDEKPMFVFDIKWITENLDYPTLLNNFIHVFEYTDLQYRSSFPKNRNQSSAIIDIFSVKGLKTYDATPGFNFTNGLFSLEMFMYIETLKQYGIEFELVIKWFFEEYIPKEFSVTGFTYCASSSGTTYLEKCKNIASEIERVLKQYRLYSVYGYIDSELFEMSSEHLIFSNLKSINGNKYVYLEDEEIICCMHDLFNNSILCCSDDKTLNEFDCFFDAIMSLGKIEAKLLNYPMQQESIKRLLAFKAISLQEGYYYINQTEVAFLKNFYEKDVLCYIYATSMHDMIKEMCEKRQVVIEDQLFTRPEQQYLNYILNKAEFSDGFNLRNKYSHGTTSINDYENQRDYLEFLKIMVLIMIKINEEFCLRDNKQHND